MLRVISTGDACVLCISSSECSGRSPPSWVPGQSTVSFDSALDLRAWPSKGILRADKGKRGKKVRGLP